jgi:hypothetical protein
MIDWGRWFPGDIRATSLIGSFFGSMAYAVVLKVKSPFQLFTIVFVGFVVAMFLGPLIANALGKMGFEDVGFAQLQNSAGFIAGLSGMAICNGILTVAGRIMERFSD